MSVTLDLRNVILLPMKQASHISFQPHVHLYVFHITDDLSWAIHQWRN
jgi:hypothetical protein